MIGGTEKQAQRERDNARRETYCIYMEYRATCIHLHEGYIW